VGKQINRQISENNWRSASCTARNATRVGPPYFYTDYQFYAANPRPDQASATQPEGPPYFYTDYQFYAANPRPDQASATQPEFSLSAFELHKYRYKCTWSNSSWIRYRHSLSLQRLIVTMRFSLDLLSKPPEGSFNLQSPGLLSRNTITRGKPCLSVWIPFDRVKDFVEGEGQRNSCSFYTRNSNERKESAAGCKENIYSDAREVQTNKVSSTCEAPLRHANCSCLSRGTSSLCFREIWKTQWNGIFIIGIAIASSIINLVSILSLL